MFEVHQTFTVVRGLGRAFLLLSAVSMFHLDISHHLGCPGTVVVSNKPTYLPILPISLFLSGGLGTMCLPLFSVLFRFWSILFCLFFWLRLFFQCKPNVQG